jgi:hypothetical protein
MGAFGFEIPFLARGLYTVFGGALKERRRRRHATLDHLERSLLLLSRQVFVVWLAVHVSFAVVVETLISRCREEVVGGGVGVHFSAF